jgi:hypothetical protein
VVHYLYKHTYDYNKIVKTYRDDLLKINAKFIASKITKQKYCDTLYNIEKWYTININVSTVIAKYLEYLANNTTIEKIFIESLNTELTNIYNHYDEFLFTFRTTESTDHPMIF